jgi:hypothetical protein
MWYAVYNIGMKEAALIILGLIIGILYESKSEHDWQVQCREHWRNGSYYLYLPDAPPQPRPELSPDTIPAGEQETTG